MTWIDIRVSVGRWGLGAFAFTVLTKATVPIELGRSRSRQPN
jgi:hypothetical protein